MAGMRSAKPLRCLIGQPLISVGTGGFFQIGFLLATVQSIALEIIRLWKGRPWVFFPTGGGKTEAYLGQTAFAIFYRRIRNAADFGVQRRTRTPCVPLRLSSFDEPPALSRAMEVICPGGKAISAKRCRSAASGEVAPSTPNRRDDTRTGAPAPAEG